MAVFLYDSRMLQNCWFGCTDRVKTFAIENQGFSLLLLVGSGYPGLVLTCVFSHMTLGLKQNQAASMWSQTRLSTSDLSSRVYVCLHSPLSLTAEPPVTKSGLRSCWKNFLNCLAAFGQKTSVFRLLFKAVPLLWCGICRTTLPISHRDGANALPL